MALRLTEIRKMMLDGDYESGPFCRHWDDPGDCRIKCGHCGHGCCEHAATEGETHCHECECPRWVEPE